MKKLYIVLLAFLSTSLLVKAQTANQYFFKAKTGVALEDVTGATTLLGAKSDLIVSDVITFFPFSFAGNSYSQFSVSEDGVVTLGNAKYAPYPYENYVYQSIGIATEGADAVFPILLPWGEDLYTADNGSVSYKILGAAPSRKLIIDFKVSSAEDNNVNNYNKNFQVWLTEGTNAVEFVYGTGMADWYNFGNIGVASANNQYLSVDVHANTAGSSEVFSNDGFFPKSGTAYTFSPVEITETTPVEKPTPVEPQPTPVVEAKPITANVAIYPEYAVAGQLKNTIYLGYGLQSVTLKTQNVAGGNATNGYSYAWSPATGLDDATKAAPIASPLTTTVYTVVITDNNGNQFTQSVTVNVVDPRNGSKFYVCKQGKTTICISKEAVESQLNTGATLGACASTYEMENTEATAAVVLDHMANNNKLVVYPNPSRGLITVQLPDAQAATVIVYDYNGRAIAQKTVTANTSRVQFDLTGNAPGMYMIKAMSMGSVRVSKIMIK